MFKSLKARGFIRAKAIEVRDLFIQAGELEEAIEARGEPEESLEPFRRLEVAGRLKMQ